MGIGHSIGDALPLRVSAKAFFAQTIADQAAKAGFSAAMAHGAASRIAIGRPDDVEAGAERNVAHKRPIALLPNDEPPHP